jgi:catechol 2,3-dioxygenase-like lactoylglutathione lyase family enzyme
VTILQNHYVLAVHDLVGTTRFFCDALGFEVVDEPPGWTFVARDHCVIMLGKCPEAIPPAELGDHSYFGYLRVDDADAYYRRLLEHGAHVAAPIENKPWQMREFGVRTPEGHRFTIGQWLGEDAD